MADLVTRLLLNSSNFDNNIRKSSLQVQQFQNIGKNVTATLGKFAGAIGAAMTAGEAFNRVIRGSLATSDLLDLAMRSVNTTIDNFFTAISTGDFSVFHNGLDGIISKARSAQMAIDQLGNTTMSYNYFSAKNNAAFLDALASARDESLSKQDRDAALKTAELILGDQREITETMKFRSIDAMKKIVAERNSLDPEDFDFVLMEDVFRIDASMNSDAIKEDLNATYQEYLNIKKSIEKKYSTKTVLDVDMFGNITYKNVIEDMQAYRTEMKKLNKVYADAILQDTLLQKDSDERLQNIMNIGTAASNAERQLASMEKSFVRLNNTAKKNVSKTDTVAPEGSLTWYDQLITAKKKELGLAINQADRIKIYNEIDKLTKEKHYIEVDLKLNSAGLKESKTSFATDMPDMKGFKIKNPIKKQDIKLNNDYADSLNAIANVMGSVTSMTNEGAAAWLSWSANLINSIAAAVPAIQTMITAKTAEAAASGAAEAAKTPFVGWLMVGGAIASILAAFAALPSFSTGGIYAGNSTIGDMNLARVNAGEMILNNRQQRNLFNLLNGNGTLSSGGNGLVEFKIKGKELVGVLNNYNNQKSKVR